MKLLVLVVFGMMLLVGCASHEPVSTPTTNPVMHAECLVCKMNVDLACVDVPVDKNTPTVVYEGKTYYFCSPECHDKFMKNPQKYLAAK